MSDASKDLRTHVEAGKLPDDPLASRDPKRPAEPTFEERRRLSLDLGSIPGDALTAVLEAVAASHPMLLAAPNVPGDDVVVDVATMDARTVRALQDLLRGLRERKEGKGGVKAGAGSVGGEGVGAGVSAGAGVGEGEKQGDGAVGVVGGDGGGEKEGDVAMGEGEGVGEAEGGGEGARVGEGEGEGEKEGDVAMGEGEGVGEAEGMKGEGEVVGEGAGAGVGDGDGDGDGEGERGAEREGGEGEGGVGENRSDDEAPKVSGIGMGNDEGWRVAIVPGGRCGCETCEWVGVFVVTMT